MTPGGKGSVNWTDAALLGPLFVTVRSYETLPLRETVDGPDFTTATSALATIANEAGANAIVVMKRRRNRRSLTPGDYSNLSSAVYSLPCESATAL